MSNTYLDILNKIKQENIQLTTQTKDSRILILDGLNNYIRTWVMNPTTNDDGVHVGGISGFLQALGVTIREIKPTRLVIVFDGKGGSVRRKKIFPGYKANRGGGVRLNRAHDWASDVEENKQMLYQLSRVIIYLKQLPCTVISIDNIEADDTIAYIAHEICEANSACEEVYISSTDKDFYQLISNKVKVWNPVTHKRIDKDAIINEYGIHPNNFILYKCLKGDGSDNIPGLKGFGVKTSVKLFPFLSEQTIYSVNDVINYAKDHLDESRMHQSLLDNKTTYLMNYDIMKLSNGNIKSSTGLVISKQYNKYVKKLNIHKIAELCTEDKLWSKFPNLNSWVNINFSQLNYFIDK